MGCAWCGEGVPPSGSWEGGPQPPGALSLHPQVSTAEVADVATYMCVAENPAGSVEKLFTLRVQGELAGQAAPWGSPAEERLVLGPT